MCTSKKEALILVYNGAADSEVVLTADILRYAGINAMYCSVEGSCDSITCGQNTRLIPDISLEQVKEKKYDAIIVPGADIFSDGMFKNDAVAKLLKDQYASGRLLASICSGTQYLQNYKIGINEATITVYPDQVNDFRKCFNVVNERLHLWKMEADDGTTMRLLLTAQGAGMNAEFALKIIEILHDEKLAKKVKDVFLF